MGRKKPARKVRTPGSRPSETGKSPKAKGRPKKVAVPCSKRGKYQASYDNSKLTEAMEEVKEGRMSERQSVSSSYVSPCSILELRRLARLWSPDRTKRKFLVV